MYRAMTADTCMLRSLLGMYKIGRGARRRCRKEQGWIHVIGNGRDVRKEETTSHRLLLEGGQPRPTSMQSDDAFEGNNRDGCTCANSRLYCSIKVGSTETSAGASAGAATKSRAGLLKGRVNSSNATGHQDRQLTQPICERATGRASQSCNWTWRRSQSIEYSSSGGRSPWRS